MEHSRLRTAFQDLDLALTNRCRTTAELACSDINRILLEIPPPKEDQGAQLPSGLPEWLRHVIRDGGVRLPALEQAFHADSVVLVPTLRADGAGLRIEIKF